MEVEEDTSLQLFDKGLFCAESVLKAIAEEHGIDSPLIPSIATGLCSGMSRTGGTCGSLTGGILALNIILGRQTERESVERNYNAVQKLISEFESRFGSSNCAELLGCHLGTEEGQEDFAKNERWNQCREYVGVTTEVVKTVLHHNVQRNKNGKD